MPTLTTIAPLTVKAENLIQCYHSWATGAGLRLQNGNAKFIELKGLRVNLAAFIAEATAIAADSGFSSLPIDLQADVNSINSDLTSVSSDIADALDVEAQWAALNDDQKITLTTPHGLGAEGLTTPADVWASLDDGRKADAVQHTIIASTTVTAIATMVVPSYR